MSTSNDSGPCSQEAPATDTTAPTLDPVTRLFDGHHDVLTRLYELQDSKAADAFLGSTDFHLDRQKCRDGNYGGGFFAIWVPSPETGEGYASMMANAEYDVPMPAPLVQSDALSVVMHQAALLQKLQQSGAVQVCTNGAELRHWVHQDRLAAIMHLEGCEAIDEDLYALDVLYAAGLRSLGPVWSRNNQFGHGVPFRFPGTPDVGKGLTSSGINLLKRCNELGIVFDLSHLNQAGFYDVAKHSRAPLIATHSNVHALCPHARNLNDEQLAAIRSSGGVVGLNFACAFLRSDGRMLADTPIVTMLRHLDYLIDQLGEDGVAIGSDFDGAEVPEVIGDAAGVPRLVSAMKAHGYGDKLLSKLCHGNWLNVIERTWLE